MFHGNQIMLLVDEQSLREFETDYPGIQRTIHYFEKATLPRCPRCQSHNTADVQVGVIGRTILIAGATSKFKLIPNGPKPGRYFCNACSSYFGES